MAFRQQVLITLQRNCQSELIWHQLIIICKGQPCGIHIEFLDYWGLSYLFSLPSNLFLFQKDLRQNCKKNFQYSLDIMTLEFSLASMSHLPPLSLSIIILSFPAIYFNAIYLLRIIVSSFSTVSSLHANKFHSKSVFLSSVYV